MIKLPCSPLELLAVVTGFLNIALAARASMWNWFFGIIMVSSYMLIFFQVKLYADMSLQVFFLVMQFYGIYYWLYGNNSYKPSVTHINSRDIIISSISFLLAFMFIFKVLYLYTDSTTIYLDAFTTSGSLIAQWLMSKKRIEHWWLWIIVNIVSIDMYVQKNLYFTAFLYGVFIILDVYGFLCWLQKLRGITYKTNMKLQLSKSN